MKRALHAAFASLVVFGNLSFGGEPAPVQSPARPFGIQAIAPVQLSGSDDRSADFNENYLPTFQQLINQHLSERAVFSDREGFLLDASRLYLRTESDKTIRIYFLHEGAGYHNSLGYSMTLAGAENPGTPYLLFPDSSYPGSPSPGAPPPSSAGTGRTETGPVLPGDFVEINKGAAGIQLDFFLVADGARNPRATWHNNPDLNSDGKQHIVAFLLPGSRYVMIGFEDLVGGGDLDYNDCLFAVDIGEVNAENLFNIEATLPQ